MNIPLQQTLAWQKLLQDLGHTTFFESKADYTFLADLKNTPVGNYLYVPYGPYATSKTGFKKAYDSLLKLARKHDAIFIRVEPQLSVSASLLKTLKAKKSHDLNPADTWILDLTGDDDSFKQRLPKRLLRYHRGATKKGIVIHTSKNPTDIHYLVDLQRKLADKKNIGVFSEKYLATELQQGFATLYTVELLDKTEFGEEYKRSATGESHSDSPRVTLETNSVLSNNSTKILAAGLVFDDESTRYNLQGAQSPEGAHLHATGILTIQLILDAREKGLSSFDFWGIAPDGAPKDHSWAGFTQFKKSFDGSPLHYCGTWDIVCNSPKYHLYQTLRKANRIKRKILK